jgi:hypothetical protein
MTNNDNTHKTDELELTEALELALFILDPSELAQRAQKKHNEELLLSGQALPMNRSRYNVNKKMLSKMGIQVLGGHDRIFWKVKLPEEWKTKKMDPNNIALMDDKNRTRATIYFDERSSNISLVTRFTFREIPVDEEGKCTTCHPTTHFAFSIYDADKEIHRIGISPCYFQDIESKERSWNMLLDQSVDYLNFHHPDWRNPLAYWD